jgi:hypothetical protein
LLVLSLSLSRYIYIHIYIFFFLEQFLPQLGGFWEQVCLMKYCSSRTCFTSAVLDEEMNDWQREWMDTCTINKAISEHFEWGHKFWSSTTHKKSSKSIYKPLVLGPWEYLHQN